MNIWNKLNIKTENLRIALLHLSINFDYFKSSSHFCYGVAQFHQKGSITVLFVANIWFMGFSLTNWQFYLYFIFFLLM